MDQIHDNNNIQNLEGVYNSMKPYIYNTPLVHSNIINNLLGHNIYFKMESMQITGSFKIRGLLNYILKLQRDNNIQNKITLYSTGNQAIALSYLAKIFNLEARVYLPKYVSSFKLDLIKFYNPSTEIIITNSRDEAEYLAKNDPEYFYLGPDFSVIEGLSTLYYESINQINMAKIDCIFAPCGSGTLLSGAVLAKEIMNLEAKIFGCEPENANDAFRSLVQNSIYRFKESPQTIADGLKALSISETTFHYLKKLEKMLLVSEEKIKYWTFWLNRLLNVKTEPSASTAMAGAEKWIRDQKGDIKNVLIILSGGNIEHHLLAKLNEGNYSLLHD